MTSDPHSGIAQWLLAARRVQRGGAVVSFMESTVLPVPLELLLVPLMQTRRRLVWRLAAAALAGCLAGALAGYAAGHLLRASAGEWIVSVVGGGPWP